MKYSEEACGNTMSSCNNTTFSNDSSIDVSISNITSEGTSLASNGYLSLVVYRSVIITIALVGMLANGAVLATMVMSKQVKKEKFNILIVNQIALDMYSCAMLAVVQSIQLANLYLTGSLGYWLCVIVLDEMLQWIGLNGSTANLVVIAVERYVKIVHAIRHKTHFKPWMIHALVAFTWINGIALNVPLLAVTTIVADGQCLSFTVWASDQASYIYGIWYFIYFFIVPLVIFIFCYGRILAVVMRQAKVFVVKPGTTSNASTVAAHRAQINVIKTMLTVTVLFVVCWLPNNVYYLLTVIIFIWDAQIYYGTIFFAYLNICLNPFVYAGQHEIIKGNLTYWIRRLVRFTRRASVMDQPADNPDQQPQRPALVTCSYTVTSNQKQPVSIIGNQHLHIPSCSTSAAP